MSTVSYFQNASKFVATNTSFNTYISEVDVLQYLQRYAATGAMHDSDERFPPPSCHPGTRKAVIDPIKAWFGYKEPPKQSIMLVHAPAGYGKSAVAQFFADDLEQQEGLDFNPLAGSFFFSRNSPERNNSARFIATLTYQFATSIPELLPFIEEVVKANPMILNKTLELQLEKLIIGPFRSIKGLDEIPNRLDIVDGLDECASLDRDPQLEKQTIHDQERAQVRVLDLILTLQSHHFPLSFLIFTRPEPWIKAHIESKAFDDYARTLDMYKAADNLQDVESLFRSRLKTIWTEYGDKSAIGTEDWPGEERLQKLVEKTRGDMLYANTIILDLEDPYEDPQERLDLILDPSFEDGADLAHSSPFFAVYEHYRQIMRSCPERNRPVMLEVLADLVLSRRLLYDVGIIPIEEGDISIALGTLDELSGRIRGRGIKSLRGLHSVIKLRPHRAGTSPFFMNGLFIRFLRHPKFSGEFAVDLQGASVRLLTACLKQLATVTPSTEIGRNDHSLRYSIVAWAGYWSMWSPKDAPEYSNMLRLLLSIDLEACFMHAFSLNPYEIDLYNLLYANDPERWQVSPQSSPQSPTHETIITSDKPRYPDHADLINQCVSHLQSSEGRTRPPLRSLPDRHREKRIFIIQCTFLLFCSPSKQG